MRLSISSKASNQHFLYSHLTLKALVLNHLHESHEMLHRDISPNNLLLIRPSLEGGKRSGMLIDFDYAALIQFTGPRTISTGFRTVRLTDANELFDLLILDRSGYTTFYGYRSHASSR